jgi:hypothetical protein
MGAKAGPIPSIADSGDVRDGAFRAAAILIRSFPIRHFTGG